MTLEFEPWWLLALPVFFALGWWASRLEQRSSARTSPAGAGSALQAQALAAVLHDDTQAAVDALTAQIQQDPDSAPLHSALALLYRRRGEVDRAIRVHQALAERTDLSLADRHRAQLELGVDYLKAGLIDRAENTLVGLEGTEHAQAALVHRIEVAQSVRDWPRALQLTESLESSSGRSQAIPRMHLHCEIAHGCADPVVAKESIDRALQAAGDHPRPWLLLGQWAWSQKDATGAIEAWNRMGELSPDHLILAAGAWTDAWAALGQPEQGARRWDELQSRLPSRGVVHACAQCSFKARRHYWQCPGCNAWDTLPARGERLA